MKRTYFVILIPILLTALQIMSNPDVVADQKVIDPMQISLIPVEKKETFVVDHGVSPLGTSSPRKASQTGRVKRAISAFDLKTIDESAVSRN